MTQEEIRKLLGGYATNTLTDGERAALFEAALEDQELFDALGNEDALRELLADPITRAQIQQALQPAPRRAAWHWLIGAASVAVAAVIAIVIVTGHREPAATGVPRQIAQSEPQLEAPAAAPMIPVPERREAKRRKAQPAPLAVPPIAGVIGGVPAAPLAAPPPVPVAAAPKQELTAGVAADAPLYTGPLVRTSVLRSGPSGDAIRIEVVSEVAGRLTLYRAAAAGQWQRVYPANGAGVPIAANIAYQIPDDPITIRSDRDKLRLMIEPTAAPSLGAQFATGALSEPRTSARLNAPRAQAQEKTAAAPAPLVVEIAIGPGIPNKGN
jgi:hypothetical protein